MDCWILLDFCVFLIKQGIPKGQDLSKKLLGSARFIVTDFQPKPSHGDSFRIQDHHNYLTGALKDLFLEVGRKNGPDWGRYGRYGEINHITKLQDEINLLVWIRLGMGSRFD